jgi:AcrR family transcriptional regulator
MTEPKDTSSRLVTAAFDLIPERGWAALSLSEVADKAEVPRDEMRRVFPCKASLLAGLAAWVEARAQETPPAFDDEDTVRDRLFELMMGRLDILADRRPAVAAILRDLPRAPLSVLPAVPALLRHVGSILEEAGIATRLPAGPLRCKGLAGVWLATIAVWVEDDSPDNARTMAALDRNLRRVEPLAQMLSPFSHRLATPADSGGF